jgi:hypothetical protein
MAKNIIKIGSILSNMHEQKTAQLIRVSILRTRDLSEYFVNLFNGQELPRGTCIQCIYIGDKNIPFSEIKRYGSASWRNLEKRIGEQFEIEQPNTGDQQLELKVLEVTE